MKNNRLFFLFLLISACGVKDDPLPPGIPVEIGQGQPDFSRYEKIQGEVLDDISEQEEEVE